MISGNNSGIQIRGGAVAALRANRVGVAAGDASPVPNQQ